MVVVAIGVVGANLIEVDDPAGYRLPTGSPAREVVGTDWPMATACGDGGTAVNGLLGVPVRAQAYSEKIPDWDTLQPDVDPELRPGRKLPALVEFVTSFAFGPPLASTSVNVEGSRRPEEGT